MFGLNQEKLESMLLTPDQITQVLETMHKFSEDQALNQAITLKAKNIEEGKEHNFHTYESLINQKYTPDQILEILTEQAGRGDLPRNLRILAEVMVVKFSTLLEKKKHLVEKTYIAKHPIKDILPKINKKKTEENKNHNSMLPPVSKEEILKKACKLFEDKFNVLKNIENVSSSVQGNVSQPKTLIQNLANNIPVLKQVSENQKKVFDRN